MKKLFFAFLAFITISNYGIAAENDSVQEKKVNYMPKFSGVVKARYEYDTDASEGRFLIRNARLSVKGDASEHINYQIQAEYGSDGKFSVQDIYVQYHINDFVFSLGQQRTFISTDIETGPGQNIFSNRSMLAKYILNYYTGNSVKSMGTRDIGMIVTYNMFSNKAVPVKLFGGIYNGYGSNNPQWGKYVNFMVRTNIGNVTRGFSGGASYYGGHTPGEITEADGSVSRQKIDVWNVEARYCAPRYKIEAAVAQGSFTNMEHKPSTATYIYGLYRFPIHKSKFLNVIYPILRYDYAKDIYYNTSESTVGCTSPHRISAGVNFGLDSKYIHSEFRLGYEHYFINGNKSDLNAAHLFNNKMTVEMVVCF